MVGKDHRRIFGGLDHVVDLTKQLDNSGDLEFCRPIISLYYSKAFAYKGNDLDVVSRKVCCLSVLYNRV